MSKVQTRRAAAALAKENVSENQENKITKSIQASKTVLKTTVSLKPAAKTTRKALGTLNQVQNTNNNTTRIVKTSARITKKRVSDSIKDDVKPKSKNPVVEITVPQNEKENKPPTNPEKTRKPKQKKVESIQSLQDEIVAPVVEEIKRESKVSPVKVISPMKCVAEVEPWEDLDEQDGYDPMMLAEYVVDIMKYMRELEVSTLPNADYMDTQKELKWSMRDVLIDWLIEIHQKFRLLPETLYLAVNIIDRFLSRRAVTLCKLQLVGITAMLVAAKYEEVCAPSLKNFMFMTDNGYTEEEILKAERYILQVLEFGLQYPSSMTFLRRCSKAEGYDIQTRTLAKYLMEISLVDYGFIGIVPSLIAAAALFLARKMLDRGEWDENLKHYSGYTENELRGCVTKMLAYLWKPLKHEALFKKYASKKFMKASVFARDWSEECGDVNDIFGWTL